MFNTDHEAGHQTESTVFVGGAFMFPTTLRYIWEGSTLREVAERMTPARLRGYQRRAVIGAPWPAMIPSANPVDEVLGFAVFGVSHDDITDMMAFDNHFFNFSRATVTIWLQDNSSLDCECLTIVWNGPSKELVPTTTKIWTPSEMMHDEWLAETIRDVERQDRSCDFLLPQTLKHYLVEDPPPYLSVAHQIPGDEGNIVPHGDSVS